MFVGVLVLCLFDEASCVFGCVLGVVGVSSCVYMCFGEG